MATYFQLYVLSLFRGCIDQQVSRSPIKNCIKHSEKAGTGEYNVKVANITTCAVVLGKFTIGQYNVVLASIMYIVHIRLWLIIWINLYLSTADRLYIPLRPPLTHWCCTLLQHPSFSPHFFSSLPYGALTLTSVTLMRSLYILYIDRPKPPFLALQNPDHRRSQRQKLSFGLYRTCPIHTYLDGARSPTVYSTYYVYTPTTELHTVF